MDQYKKLTIPQLKQKLLELGLATTGRKPELLERLIIHEKDVVQASKYEKFVQDRDYNYYKYIKPHIDSLPDLLLNQMQSKEAKASVKSRVWDDDAKWHAIHNELEIMDQLGEEKQIQSNLFDMVNGPIDNRT